MGLDLHCFPVRLDSAPLRLMRAHARAWEIALDHRPFSRFRGDSLPDVSRALLAELPAGPDRQFFFPDRSYEQAEYLLDPTGRRAVTTWAERERTLPYRIIHGDQPFAEHARGGQGVPWRCSTGDFLAEAAARIDSLDPGAVRREFSVAEMASRGLYKTPEGADDDEVFACVLGHLRRLSLHYRRTAADGLDLMVVQD